MSERDLIERLRAYPEAYNAAMHLHAHLGIDKFPDINALVIEAASTIATLSEALAEAEKKGAEAAAMIDALQNPWSSDMSAMPRGQDVLVYQPASKTGRSTLPARICELRNAGYIRESTHWMVPTPPRDLPQGGQL